MKAAPSWRLPARLPAWTSVFSALALLTHPARDRSHAFVMLDRFDTVRPVRPRSCARLAGEDQRLSA
jgi:hypothetical protein